MAALNTFAGFHANGKPTVTLSEPARTAEAVTPSDSVDLTYVSRALYIGVAGDIVVNMKDIGTSITFKAVPVGILPIRVSRVLSTGTTATNIVSLS